MAERPRQPRVADSAGENLVGLVTEHGQPIEKVLIAVPCGDHVAAGFAQDLALLMGYTTFVRPDTELALYFLRGTYLPRARAGLVQAAIDRAASHILWLDSDMRFPKDTLLQLLRHNQPIVAANYPMRIAPIVPTAVDGDLQGMYDAAEGLQVAKYCGMGVMLTAVEVFLKIGKPYFALGYSKISDDYSSEDTFFCQRARECGYSILIDPALSEHVKHCGMMDFTMAHARMTRVVDQQLQAVEQSA